MSIHNRCLPDRRCLLRSCRGFTFIEMIVSLVLIGMLTAVVGKGMVHITQGFVSTRMNSATQKGQAAMSRICLELKNIESIDGESTETSLKFKSYKGGCTESKTRVIRKSGNGKAIEIDDGDGVFHTLTDSLAADGLKFRYEDSKGVQIESGYSAAKIIAVTVKISGGDGGAIQFKERITPRN